MNNREMQSIEYLKKRLADLQQYVSREIEMIMNDLKQLEDTTEKPKVVTEVDRKLVKNTTWDHIPDVLAPTDLRKILRIGKSQAYDLVNSQQFHHIRIGRRILIPKQAFIDWLEGSNK